MSENWYPSKWGSNDEIGALNLVSPRKIAAAARLVNNGKVYNLAQVLEDGIPSHPFHGPFWYATFRRHSLDLKSPGKQNDAGGMNTRIEMADHTGTHIDSLNHVSIGDRVYNGIVAEDIVGFFGSTKLGIEKTPPIFTRGVLLDVAAARGVDVLEPGYAVTERDLKECLEAKKMKLEAGDAVLVRTGWMKYWMTDNKKFLGTVPGIDYSAAKWLADQGAAIVGADTWNVEVDPTEDLRGADAVHQHLLTKNGIRLIENLSLDELSRDGVSEFLFVCLPLRLKGGTGSPITPIAVT